jgi:Uma2 family endonuclease
MSAAESLLTAEEYLALPENGIPNELVRGKIVPLYVPTPRHGQICGQVIFFIHRYLEDHDLGHLVCNDSGIITERAPDTVRGADIGFYSYKQVPPGPLPQGYLPVSPELVFEVRSPIDRWSAILTKVAEYLEAGVTVVCVLDQMTERCHVYRSDDPGQEFTAEQELTIPDVLPGFQVVVRCFFV